MTHPTEEELVLHYYAEADDDRAIEQHLEQCGSCRAGYQELQRVLALANCDPVPEQTGDYGSRVWGRLRPRLKRRYTFNWTSSLFRPGWAVPATLAGALVAVFLLGRYWPLNYGEPVAQIPVSVVRGRVLLASLSEHLERAQMALTELSHAHGDGEVDISTEQSRVHEILEENRILRLSVPRAREPGVADLLEDLERILLEIENSPSRIEDSELNRIRQHIDSVEILFKMRVIEERLRHEQRAAAQALARRSS